METQQRENYIVASGNTLEVYYNLDVGHFLVSIFISTGCLAYFQRQMFKLRY